jgi:hypothetical protein
LVRWDRREPLVLDSREVPVILQQRPAGPLEPLTLLGPLQGTDLRAPDLIERILHQTLDMEAIEHDLRLRRPVRDRLDVRGRHVHCDAFELADPLGPQGVEEALERGDVLPLGRPHHALFERGSTTTVRYSWCRRYDSSSMPMYSRSSSRSSWQQRATTRSMMEPTVRQAILIVVDTVV